MTVRVLICDDNQSVRATLGKALSLKKGLEVIGEASTYEEIAKMAQSMGSSSP